MLELRLVSSQEGVFNQLISTSLFQYFVVQIENQFEYKRHSLHKISTMINFFGVARKPDGKSCKSFPVYNCPQGPSDVGI